MSTLDTRKATQGKSSSARTRPPFECVTLLLQGGGALGAYQAGVYEALAEIDLHPDWIAGVSIGSVNAAIIAGNAPEERVDKLRQFWQRITEPVASALFGTGDFGLLPSHVMLDAATRQVANQLSAGQALVAGATGFFFPRVPVPWLWPTGTIGATSFYDTGPLTATLEDVIDFDRINAGETRLSLGAVNVASGNSIYFDTTTHRIGPEHVMASGALPPGFPAVEIDGEHYWDGGLISNSPSQWVAMDDPRRDMLAFQVDLWSARGELPRNMAHVLTRQKEIQYSSRTRANTDRFKQFQVLRNSLDMLLHKLPAELSALPEVAALKPFAERKVYNLVHLIYRARQYEGDSKDYEFSRQSMEEHWQAGYRDTARTLRHPEVLQRPTNPEGVAVFDVVDGD
jgi:NTE family protein